MGNPHIQAALALLDPADRPQVEHIRLTTREQELNGCYLPHSGAILINRVGDSYLRATRGDVRRLAATLAHEQCHALHGRSEQRARAATARVMTALGLKE